LLVALLIAALLTPNVQAIAWLNWAQVARLHGDDRQAAAAFARSLALDPHNTHVRWQMGTFLTSNGDAQAALTTLLPLAHRRPLDPTIARLLLALFFATGRSDEASALYQGLAPKPPVPSGIAARLANRLLVNSGALSPDLTTQLLAQVLSLDMSLPECQVYAQQWKTANFWSTSLGQSIRAALQWRSQPIGDGKAVASEDYTERSRVAAMLGIDPDAVGLGTELVTNGSFEQHDLAEDTPVGWRLSSDIMGYYNPATFVVGVDREHGWMDGRSLRIDGLHEQRLVGRQIARAGYSHAPIPLAVGKPYVISFVYRTARTTSPLGAALWFTYDPQVLFANHRFFPATGGRWQRVTMIGWNRSGKDATVIPTLQQWSEGSAWFDEFSIRAVRLDSPAPPRDALIQVMDADAPSH
jgi:hypothetical protein